MTRAWHRPNATRLTIAPIIVLGAFALLQTRLGPIVASARAQDGRQFELLRMPQLRIPAIRTDGNFPSPGGSPRPNMWFATGSLDPNMALSSNRRDAGLSALSRSGRRVSRSIVASAFDRNVSADPDDAGDGSTSADQGSAFRNARRRLPAGGIAPGCTANEVESELQGGGEFWTGQARSAAPTSFPRNVFAGNRHGAADPLALGPTGDPVNLPAPGPAGNWCRPPATAMSQSSPLVTRAFWIVLLFPTAVLLVFGLSRGFRLRPVTDTK